MQLGPGRGHTADMLADSGCGCWLGRFTYIYPCIPWEEIGPIAATCRASAPSNGVAHFTQHVRARDYAPVASALALGYISARYRRLVSRARRHQGGECEAAGIDVQPLRDSASGHAEY